MKDLKEKIEAVLESYWDNCAIPVSTDPSTTSELVAPLDSMSALEVLIELDDIVGKKLNAESVIRKGGYDSREQFVTELTMNVLAEIQKKPA